MKQLVIVNVGLLLEAVRKKGCNGIAQASALCRTSPTAFHKLMKGELPRLDALQRICRGLGLTESQLIIAAVKPKPEQPAEIIELPKPRPVTAR